MKNFTGNVLFLDRSDINTDEIIPARYLTENTKDALKPYLLEDLELAGFDAARDIENTSAIVTRANFGCGSSREHAPWALEVNDINIVIAEGYSRIFKQNMFNCGMIAIELAAKDIELLFEKFSGRSTKLVTNMEKKTLKFMSGDDAQECTFTLSAFDQALVEAGGWVGYADAKY